MARSNGTTGGMASTATRCGEWSDGDGMARISGLMAFWPLSHTQACAAQWGPMSHPVRRLRTIHRAWVVAAVAFVALVGAAGFRATPGVLIVPLQDEFGWTRAATSLAVS